MKPERSFRWVVIGPVLQFSLMGLFAVAVVGFATAVVGRRTHRALSPVRPGSGRWSYDHGGPVRRRPAVQILLPLMIGLGA
ncbi:MAG: hypothetical protein M3Y04_09780 [Actinomycetota bacterium]|nr:hypothetical protein [Actinomycetota bacterium]